MTMSASTEKMMVLESNDYGEEVDRLIREHGDVLRQMESEIPVPFDMDTHSFMLGARAEFERRTGDHASFLGGVPRALQKIREQR